MKYLMTVTIADPNTPEGMCSDLIMRLNCVFVYDPDQYGNGHYVGIGGTGFYRQVIDLRYDTSFDPDNKPAYLERWANSYWSGKDDAYYVKSIRIEKVEAHG